MACNIDMLLTLFSYQKNILIDSCIYSSDALIPSFVQTISDEYAGLVLSRVECIHALHIWSSYKKKTILERVQTNRNDFN